MKNANLNLINVPGRGPAIVNTHTGKALFRGSNKIEDINKKSLLSMSLKPVGEPADYSEFNQDQIKKLQNGEDLSKGLSPLGIPSPLRESLKELIHHIVKESLTKSELEGQPKLTIPVTLHLNPKQTIFSSAEAVATLKNSEEVYDLARGGANELVGELVATFAKDINDVRVLEMSKSELKAYLLGMIESLKSATDPEDIKLDIDNIKKTLRDNLYTIPPELEKASFNNMDAIISQLEEMVETLQF